MSRGLLAVLKIDKCLILLVESAIEAGLHMGESGSDHMMMITITRVKR